MIINIFYAIAGIILAQKLMKENRLFSQNWREIMDYSETFQQNCLQILLFCLRFFSHLINFNEIFAKEKMSKSLTISTENNPCHSFDLNIMI